MRHRLLLWPLIVLLPFAGIRMVCVELPRDGAAGTEHAGAGCDESCPLPKPRDPGTPLHDASGGTGCVLFADGSLHLLVSGAAVLPAPPPIDISFVLVRFEPDDSRFYLGPVLTQGTPPPKA